MDEAASNNKVFAALKTFSPATGLGLQDARTWQLGNTAVNRLLWTPDSGLSLIGWADGTHLEDHALDESTA